jgi:hypothetical protein
MNATEAPAVRFHDSHDGGRLVKALIAGASELRVHGTRSV